MPTISVAADDWDVDGAVPREGAWFRFRLSRVRDDGTRFLSAEEWRLDLDPDGQGETDIPEAVDGVGLWIDSSLKGWQARLVAGYPDTDTDLVALINGYSVDPSTLQPLPAGSTALELIANVQATANTATTTANDAHTVATGAATTADGAASDAADAKSAADDVAGVVNDGRLSETELSNTFVAVLTSDGSADQTARINAALATVGRKTVRLIGAFNVSAPLVLNSDTTLDASDATLTAIGASGFNMWQNRACKTKQRSTTGTMTAGSNSITIDTGSFTSADVGRSIVVWDTGNHVNNPQSVDIGAMALHTRIVSVAGSTAVLGDTADFAVTSTAVDIYDRDKNIVIRGGVWDRGALGGVPAGGSVHLSIINRCDRLTIENVRMKSTAGKYAINVADITNFSIRDIDFAVNSDGVHVNGPASKGHIERITGTTGDDAIPLLGANEYAGHDYGAFPCGAITDVSVTNTTLDSVGRAVCLTGAPGRAMARVTVRGIRGTAQNHVVALAGWGTLSPGNWDIHDIVIDDISCVPPASTYALVNMANSSPGSTTFTRIRVSSLQIVNPSNLAINIGTGMTVSDLVLDGVTVNQPTGTGGHIIRLNTGATVTSPIVMSNISAVFPSGSGEILYAEAPCEVNMSNISVRAGGRAVWYQTATAGDCIVRQNNVSATNGTLATVAGGTLTVMAANVSCGAPSGGGYQISGTTAALTVLGGPFTTTSTFAQVSKSGTQVLRANGATLPADVSKLTGALRGDIAMNTVSGLSCGLGPCIYNPTGKVWTNMVTAATYAMP